jgi:hypothetical protein
MKILKRALGAGLVLATAILAQSCDNTKGIFYGVQQETKPSGQTIFLKTVVTHALRFGGKYYATTARLYARTVAGTDWSMVAIPASTSSYVRAIATDDGATTLYAATDSGIFSSTNGTTWSAVAITPPTLGANQSFAFDDLYSANGQVFAEGHLIDTSGSTPTSEYNLYNVGATSEVTGLGIANAITVPFVGVAFDGTNYWYATQGALFSGSAADATSNSAAAAAEASIITAVTPGTNIYARLSSPGSLALTDLYLTTTTGFVFRDSSSTWTSSANLGALPLSDSVVVPSASGNLLLLGTNTSSSSSATGYLEGPATGLSLTGGSLGAVTKNATIYAQTLGTLPVLKFFYDDSASPKTLFACVAPGNANKTYGIYFSTYDGSAWSGWQ